METGGTNKRVVVVLWKDKTENPIEVFSSLKNFCLSYPAYNYNTLNNYLGKNRIAYDNQTVRIERKNVFIKPKLLVAERKIQAAVRRVALHEADDHKHDLNYWLSKPEKERLAAVTLLIRQTMSQGQRIDKNKVEIKKLQSVAKRKGRG